MPAAGQADNAPKERRVKPPELATLLRFARSAMLPPCVMMARILWCTCETALGPWAGAIIAAPGGRSAERTAR